MVQGSGSGRERKADVVCGYKFSVSPSRLFRLVKTPEQVYRPQTDLLHRCSPPNTKATPIRRHAYSRPLTVLDTRSSPGSYTAQADP